MGSAAQIGRTGALDAKVEAEDNWNYVTQQTAEWNAEVAQQIVQSVIDSGVDFNVIYAENDDMARGAVAALDRANISHGVGGDVIIMGFDCNKWALEEVLAGRWNYDGQCNPFQASYIDEIIKNLEQGNLDMAILATPLEHPSILEIPLYYEHFVAYIGEDNPLLENDIFPADPPEEGMWVLQEGHCLRNQVANYCHMKNNANHIYEAGAIDTLVRIVDCNGGFTLIPELHVQFLSESQRSRTRTLANPPAVRDVSIVVREDYVKERMLNAVADVIKMIVPSELIDERMKRFAIRLK